MAAGFAPARSSALQTSRPRQTAVVASSLRTTKSAIPHPPALKQHSSAIPATTAAAAAAAGAAEAVPALRPPPIRRPQPAPACFKKQQHQRMSAAAAARAMAAQQQQQATITLAVVGDVHSQWDEDSEAALLSLGADVAVFVGDFGEENVQLIRQIAAVPCPKAVILGNHDAWFSLTASGRRRYMHALLSSSSLQARQRLQEQQGPAEGGSTPAIAAQLEALGKDHIGFRSKRFSGLGLTLLGGRPFSKGGKRWSDVADFYEETCGVGSMHDSALRMLDVALAAEPGDVKVLVAHNGPSGLGGRRHSICGVDWIEPEADFGDPDLQEALDMMGAQGLRIPLVLFGHMHSQLSGSGLRNMAEVDPARSTVFLNAATVPRIRSFPAPAGGNGNGSGAAGGSLKGHHFLVVELRQGVVAAARDVWVGVQRCSDQAADGDGSSSSSSSRQCMVLQEQELVKTSLAARSAAAAGEVEGREAAVGNGNGASAAAASASSSGGSSGGYVCTIFRAHTGEWEPFVLQLPGAAAASQLAEAC